MNVSHRDRPWVPALGTLLVLLLSAACATVDVPETLPSPTSSIPNETTRTGRDPNQSCDLYATLPPAETVDLDLAQPEPGTFLHRLRARGELRVGVDIATPQLSSLDSRTGTYEGFEVDLVRRIAAELFGLDPDDTEAVDDAIVFVPTRSAERAQALADNRVDLVASAFSITCARRQAIAFSAPYLVANQRILVHVDDEAQEPEDLAGRVVCTSAGSTAIDNLIELSDDNDLNLQVEAAPERGECLVRLQTGRADAMATDDAILAGMATQDSTLEVRGEPYSSEPYGIGLPAEEPDWLRYVNAVLAEMIEDGTWHELYNEYFGESLDPADPPVPNYQDVSG